MCNSKWPWSQAMKQQMKLKSRSVCKYCGHRQYLSEKSQCKHAVLSIIIAFSLIGVFNNTAVPIVLHIIFFILGIVVLSLTFPFVMGLSNEKEQL
ncbi:TIGR04104 family putative zinc finger protein [Halobacillus sp. H74]|uniref:TIGR04104 family putative zinc finger protein n=1 Tax=Halobacillus sp. H74 TaxID=3457436 RepID=UPI003FCD0A11